MYARYTVVLRDLIENEQTKPLLDKALSNYPLYTGKKKYDLIPTREELNKKLLNHYKYREIGFETVGRFLDELEITMDEIMPYYNEMFKSIEIMADLENPFDNVDMTETYEETTQNSSESSGNSSSSQESSAENASNASQSSSDTQSANSSNTLENEEKSTRKHSDTPTNNLSDINQYMSDYTVEDKTGDQTATQDSSSESSSESSSNTSGTSSSQSSTSDNTTSEASSEGSRSYTHHRKGNQGVNTYAHDMNEFRTSIIDTVDSILHDQRLNELFMLVW